MFTSLFAVCRTIVVAIAPHTLAFLLAASVALNVTLSQELRASRQEQKPPLPGTTLPPMRGVTGLIRAAAPTDADLPAVFYYFSTSCGWCERNWLNIEALAKQTAGRYRVVGVAATDEIPPIVTERSIPLSVLTRVDINTLDAYGFRGTPQTVVVGSDGRVLKSWTGAFQGDQKRQIERFFEVTLPGLSERRPKP